MEHSIEPHPWEISLVSLAVELGAGDVSGMSAQERTLMARAEPVSAHELKEYREQIRDGLDPLGDAFIEQRSAEERRGAGATYTPQLVVQAMLAWAFDQPRPDRVVDPGVGSARFLCAAGRAFRKAHLMGVELD